MAALSGAIAVVTGASRGIGRGVALGLGEAGATVYVTGRTVQEGAAPLPGSIGSAAEEVTRRGGTGIPVQVDHGDDAQIEALFARVKAEQGRIDILVNNVFKIPDPPVWGGHFFEHPVSIWDDMVGIGLRAHYVASVHAAPLMISKPGGLIVNISSVGADMYLFSTAYGVGKTGVERLAKDFAHELREFGITCVALRPGTVKTEFVVSQVEAGAAQLDLDAAESPVFSGRAVAALAADPQRIEKTGRVLNVAELAREYGFKDD